MVKQRPDIIGAVDYDTLQGASRAVKKLVVTEKEIAGIIVDPLQETADVDIENNYYPRRIIPSRIESFKAEGGGGLISRDIMQDIKTELRTDDENEEDEEE